MTSTGQRTSVWPDWWPPALVLLLQNSHTTIHFNKWPLLKHSYSKNVFLVVVVFFTQPLCSFKHAWVFLSVEHKIRYFEGCFWAGFTFFLFFSLKWISIRSKSALVLDSIDFHYTEKKTLMHFPKIHSFVFPRRIKVIRDWIDIKVE